MTEAASIEAVRARRKWSPNRADNSYQSEIELCSTSLLKIYLINFIPVVMR